MGYGLCSEKNKRGGMMRIKKEVVEMMTSPITNEIYAKFLYMVWLDLNKPSVEEFTCMEEQLYCEVIEKL